MKIGIIAVFLFLLSAGIVSVYSYVSSNDSCPLKTSETASSVGNDGTEKRPVLVELFTSEGCSSCPPADRELTFLEDQQPVSGAEIVALAFHVDYWDRLGWKDTFSSADYSARQNEYSTANGRDTNYTPQMIVDGEKEFVGSDGQKANDAIAGAAGNEKGSVALNANENEMTIEIGRLPKHGNSRVLLAVAEDGLVTKVKAGENGGRTLSHTSVVRQLAEIGSIDRNMSDFKTSISLPSDAQWRKENLKYVVFVQEKKNKRVIAVGLTRPATN